MKHLIPTLFALSTVASTLSAQSLFLADADRGDAQPVILLNDVSMHFIAEPETRVIQKHDIITIIIDENSSTTSSQKLETEKESSSSANIDAMISWLKLLELRVEQGDINNVDLIDLATSREFSGEGDYERKDRFTARISAIVREVKPNGTMLVEARKTIARDSEISELVLSGLVREEDITQQNTVLSSQMADLRIILENQGDLKEAAEKGLITRVLDAVFAF
ncbi:MAG: flagellar basal body L-ring protein FlgH [Phycisphaerales bacterium]|nr:flagellar basal body L-ring protein FlgH [Phycisphaerales bacterium]